MKRQNILRSANWGAFVAALLGLFVIINYLSYRHFERFDWTGSESYSLSPQTEKVLTGLKDDIEVSVLLPPGDEVFENVDRLLQSFRAASSKVKVELLDPEKDRQLYELTAKKYGVTTPQSVIFACRDSSKWVEKDQMVEYDFSGGDYMQPKVSTFKGESVFLNAILEVTDPRRPKVYFTVGHGERRDQDQNNTGVSLFKERIRKEGGTVEELQTLGLQEIPRDASLVVVAGIQKAFSAEESGLLDSYLSKGGRLLLLADPVIEQGKELKFGATGLEGFCRKWGIELQDTIVVDPKGALPQMGAQTFFAVNYSQHKTVVDLAKNKYALLFLLSRSLEKTAPQDKDYKAEELVSTSPDAWGETDLMDLKNVNRGASDPQGPLPLAIAVGSEVKGKEARMIVVSDSDAFSDIAFFSQAGANYIFAMNAVHYLLSMEERIAIPPKEIKEKPVVLTSNQLITNFIILVILYPFLVGLAGMFVFFSRRR